MNAQSEIRNCLLVVISFVCAFFLSVSTDDSYEENFFAFTFPIRTILLCHIDYIVIEIEIENKTRCTLLLLLFSSRLLLLLLVVFDWFQSSICCIFFWLLCHGTITVPFKYYRWNDTVHDVVFSLTHRSIIQENNWTLCGIRKPNFLAGRCSNGKKIWVPFTSQMFHSFVYCIFRHQCYGWLVGWLKMSMLCCVVLCVVLCCVVLIESSSQPMVMVTSFQNQYEWSCIATHTPEICTHRHNTTTYMRTCEKQQKTQVANETNPFSCGFASWNMFAVFLPFLFSIEMTIYYWDFMRMKLKMIHSFISTSNNYAKSCPTRKSSH